MELTRLFSFFYLSRGHEFDRVSRGVQETNVLLLIFFPHLPKNKGKSWKLSEWSLNTVLLPYDVKVGKNLILQKGITGILPLLLVLVFHLNK
jgi:hypothetical protein